MPDHTDVGNREAGAFRHPVSRTGRLSLLLALILLAFVFVLPNDIEAFSPWAFLAFPVELPALVLALAVLPRRGAMLSRIVILALLAAVLIVKVADIAAFQALARPLNLILDIHLVEAGWTLFSGTVGTASAVAMLVGALVLASVLVLVLDRALLKVQRTAQSRRLVTALAAGAVLAGSVALDRFDVGEGRVSTETTTVVRAHIDRVAQSVDDLIVFQTAARTDPVADIPDEALMERIAGRDVVMLFVESYGRTVVENPLYRTEVEAVLDGFQTMLDDKGMAAASGYFSSPVVGGQSWLGHASMLSGLWVDNQRRYAALLASGRQTLIGDFDRAGWRTAAFMPAITMAWPEGQALGYDIIYDKNALGYAGLPFNWVTMPDQYTLSALQRFELAAEAAREPIFAEVALISSHAPWTPIPELVPWSDVGDGSIFNAQAQSGATPREVWSDDDRIRLQFRRSIEYALTTIASYVETVMAPDTVMIIVGDHQPARLVTGGSESRDVVFHVVAQDEALVELLSGALSLEAGMVPASDGEGEPMSVFRERFVRALSMVETEEGSGQSADELLPSGPI